MVIYYYYFSVPHTVFLDGIFYVYSAVLLGTVSEHFVYLLICTDSHDYINAYVVCTGMYFNSFMRYDFICIYYILLLLCIFIDMH